MHLKKIIAESIESGLEVILTVDAEHMVKGKLPRYLQNSLFFAHTRAGKKAKSQQQKHQCKHKPAKNAVCNQRLQQ